MAAGERPGCWWSVLAAAIPWRCSQRPPPRLGHVLGAGGGSSLASQSQAPGVALRTPLRPVAGVLVPRRPPPRPSLRSPRPPATARPLVCKSSAPRLRHRVRAFDSLPPLGQLILRATAAPPSKTPPSLGVLPHACGPRAAAAPAPLRLSPSLPLLQSPAPSSRSHRVRARQGILPVKNFGRWNSASQQSPLRPNF